MYNGSGNECNMIGRHFWQHFMTKEQLIHTLLNITFLCYVQPLQCVALKKMLCPTGEKELCYVHIEEFKNEPEFFLGEMGSQKRNWKS